MIQSMTAFARKQAQGDWGSAIWEIRTVNHRYLDCFFKLPDALRELESNCREILGKSLSRGKVECSLRFQAGKLYNSEINLNIPLVKSLFKSCEELKQHLGPQSINLFDFLRWPGVVEMAEIDYSLCHDVILQLFEETLSNLVEIRAREGAATKLVIQQRLSAIKTQIDKAFTHQRDVVTNNKIKLFKRFEELNLQLDSSRIEQEIVLLTQKMDIAEELDRLNTHVSEVFRILDKGKIIGRQLDFLMQELNREANTLGSKSVETLISGIAIDLKVLIEQIREQVQNIE